MTRTRFLALAFVACMVLALIAALGSAVPSGASWADWASGGFLAYGVGWVLDAFGAAP